MFLQLKQSARPQTVVPEVLLPSYNDSETVARFVLFAAQNYFAEFFRRFLPGVLVFALTQNFGKGNVQANELYPLGVALGGIVALLQNHRASLDAGIFKPRLGVAFQNRVYLEMGENPRLQGEAVFDIKPTR
ncbi:MAG: hypothetical protein ABSH38_14535 [Verrucomicrobiota bacterium]